MDFVGHQITKKPLKTKKPKKKTKKKKNKQTGNNSTYHEPLSEEWIEMRF